MTINWINKLSLNAPSREVAVDKLAYKSWLKEQLAAGSEDFEVETRMKDFKLRIKYDAGMDYSGVDELRALQYLDKPIESAWALSSSKIYGEKARPRQETQAALLIRAVYSKWQLRELLVDFWHNHFSVDSTNEKVALALPVYDRDVIRAHCLGNFREMLEAVATSTAMQFYLNQRSSRAGAANENYARELFELHTLGRSAYLNEFYDKWKKVPGAQKGKPEGYIDQDVYEAARAFTGWTVADGSVTSGQEKLPNTGRFHYHEGWHDNYQKRVLAQEFNPFEKEQSDGRRVLTIAASHKQTSLHLCYKLCSRLYGDNPPKSLIESAAAVWRANETSKKQIELVVERIALSSEFEKGPMKVKRPVELAASYIKASSIGFDPTIGLIGHLDACGQKLFTWPTPTGNPDNDSYWLSSNMLRRRWELIQGLTDNWWKVGELPMKIPEKLKMWDAALHLGEPLLGDKAQSYLSTLFKLWGIEAEGGQNKGQLKNLTSMLGMSPAFQVK